MLYGYSLLPYKTSCMEMDDLIAKNQYLFNGKSRHQDWLLWFQKNGFPILVLVLVRLYARHRSKRHILVDGVFEYSGLF